MLSVVAPLGLAAAAGSALVVDLDPEGPAYPGPGSLAALVADGPRLTDLRPARSGVAILRNGGVAADAASEVLEAIVAGWPAVVFRLPATAAPARDAVCVASLVPRPLFSHPTGSRLVLQSCGWRLDPPDEAVVLPRPSRTTMRRLVEGVMPPRLDRWVRAWRPVWRWGR